MRITILGCGCSAGVPNIFYGYGSTDCTNPKNKRTRSAAYVTVDGIDILIDAGPDLKYQLIKNGIKNIDAILLSHAHYDHVGGLPELKQLFVPQKKCCDLYGSSETIDAIAHEYPYLVEDIGEFKAIMRPKRINSIFQIGSIEILPFDIWHGYSWCTGFRIKNFAYTTDIAEIPEESYMFLSNLDCWVVDCLSREEKIAHANISKIITWVEHFRPKMTLLTHMNHTLDYDTLLKELPANIRPAYDGLQLEI